MKNSKKKTAKKPVEKKQSKKKITNLIIVDASGSMASKREEVIGGLKQLFSQIKEDMKKDEKKVSTRNIILDFSGQGDIRTIINSDMAEDLKDSVAESYKTRGMTALLDAIGKGFSMVDKNTYGVFISILTDGMENDSKEFTSEQIKELIEDAKKKNWAVTFMGTTEDAISKARSLGVTLGNTMKFVDTREGVKKVMKKTLLKARTSYYGAATSSIGLENSSRKYIDSLLQKDNN